MKKKMIQNVEYTVPSAVKNFFYSYIGFGDEYVIYTASRSSYSTSVYILLLRKVGQSNFTEYRCSYNGSVYNISSSSSSVEEIAVEYPYYSYSSTAGVGTVELVPSAHGLGILCLVIIAGCLVLRTVFGGIKVWSTKRRVVV